MRNILYIMLILPIFMQLSHGNISSETAAIVGNEIISVYDLKNRIQLIINSQNQPTKEEEVNKIIFFALQELIDEELLDKEAKKYNLIVKPEEINSTIRKISSDNNLSEEKFLDLLKKRHIDLESLRNQLKGQLTKSHILSDVILPKLSITERELNETIQTSAGNELELDLKKISIDFLDQKDATKKKNLIESLKRKINSCHNVQFLVDSKFSEFRLEHLVVNSKELPEMVRKEISETEVNKTTKIMRDKNDFQFFVVCQKRFLDFSDDARQNLYQALMQNKLSLQSNLYLTQIRRKTHIEIQTDNLDSLTFSTDSLNIVSGD